MNVNANMTGMGLYSFIGILSVVLGIVKELLIIFLLIRGIQVTNVYLKKNKEEPIEKVVEEKPIEIETEKDIDEKKTED